MNEPHFQPAGRQAPANPERRALLKTFSLGAGSALLPGTPAAWAAFEPSSAAFFKSGWLLSHADLESEKR